nr:MAG TPA: hypothetical protein [Caudoviricetes sp.]
MRGGIPVSDEKYMDPSLQPSDKTLTTKHRSLKPGNYPARTDLTPYLGENIDNLDTYKPEIPFGVGDDKSIVFIYPQGTIEVIGKVYCWNKLVKPGVYSRFEKLRYLNNEVVPTKEGDTPDTHYTGYNRTVTIPANPYVQKRNKEKEEILQYRYVSFTEQVTLKDGTLSYPIPIVNGILTVYPDGTFKTEGVVVNSKTEGLVDSFGYLGDQDNHSSHQFFYDGITKSEIDPKQVYQLLERKEDGTTVYGPIEANKVLVRDGWIRLPEQLVPINDGIVQITEFGYVYIRGTVITGKGHRVVKDYFKVNDLRYHLDDPTWVDTSVTYNPKIVNFRTANHADEVVKVSNKDDPQDRYRYHYVEGCYRVNVEIDGDTGCVFYPMPGWDNFVAEDGVRDIDYYLGELKFLSSTLPNTTFSNKIDKRYYPYVTIGVLDIYGKYRYPILRPNTSNNGTAIYQTIDHNPEYFNYTDLTTVTPSIEREYYGIYDQNYIGYQRYPKLLKQDKVVGYPFDKDTFIPYRDGSVTFIDRGGVYYLRVKGHVIYKREQEYFVLTPGECILSRTWPDIRTDENGHPYSLYTVGGYFTDEPVFMTEANATTGMEPGNFYNTIHGLRRREPGIFKLIHRNITAHLTSYEKMLIDSIKGQWHEYEVEEFTGKVIETKGYYTDIPYTHRDTKLDFDVTVFRYQEVFPLVVKPEAIYVPTTERNPRMLNRWFRYDRARESLELNKKVGVKFTSNVGEVTYRLVDDGVVSRDKAGTVTDFSLDSNYTDITSTHTFPNGDKYYRPEQHFNARNTHLVSSGPVRFTGTPFTKIMLRYNNDLAVQVQEIEIDKDGVYLLDLSNIGRDLKYIEAWIDDPFSFEEEMVMRNLYRRIDIRYSNDFKPVTVNTALISTRTNTISGVGEPLSTVYIETSKPPYTRLAKLRVSSNGAWKVNLPQTLLPNVSYTVTQRDLLSNISTTSFIVRLPDYNTGDVVRAEELTGMRDCLLYPVNIVHPGNTSKVLVRGSITIDKLGNYTISGVVVVKYAHQLFILKEGSYKVGIPFDVIKDTYKSHLTSLNTKFNDTPTYKYNTVNDSNLAISTTRTKVDLGDYEGFEPHLSEYWITPDKYWEGIEQAMKHASVVSRSDYNLLNSYITFYISDLFTDDPIYSIMKHPNKALRGNVYHGSIGRVADKMVFDDFRVLDTTGESNRIWLDQSNDSDELKSKGYTPLEFVTRLRTD